MSTPGKIILAVVLAYIALAASSLIGGFMVGMLGAALQLSPPTIRSLVWWLPKIIFAAIALLAYVIWTNAGLQAKQIAHYRQTLPAFPEFP
jgi:hypothetical protein